MAHVDEEDLLASRQLRARLGHHAGQALGSLPRSRLVMLRIAGLLIDYSSEAHLGRVRVLLDILDPVGVERARTPYEAVDVWLMSAIMASS